MLFLLYSTQVFRSSLMPFWESTIFFDFVFAKFPANCLEGKICLTSSLYSDRFIRLRRKNDTICKINLYFLKLWSAVFVLLEKEAAVLVYLFI